MNESGIDVYSCTSGIVLLLDVLDETRVHSGDVDEQSLHGRIVGDTSSATRIRLHPVDEDVQLAAQRRAEFLHFIHLAILILLSKTLLLNNNLLLQVVYLSGFQCIIY